VGTIRPTNVDENLYINFGNKCRSERKRIKEVLEKLMELYIKEGEKLFS